MQVRRVVTGHDTDGRAVVLEDATVDPIRPALMPGTEFHRIWGDDGPVVVPHGGPTPDLPYFPGPGGHRVVFWSVPPTAGRPEGVDVKEGLAEIEATLPGMLAHMERDHPGMHTTDSIDVDLVLDGEVWLELDDGVEVHLQAGDCVVQTGTRHAWRNHGGGTARLVAFVTGATRVPR